MRERVMVRGARGSGRADLAPDPRLAFVRCEYTPEGHFLVMEMAPFEGCAGLYTLRRSIGFARRDRGRMTLATWCPDELRWVVRAFGQARREGWRADRKAAVARAKRPAVPCVAEFEVV